MNYVCETKQQKKKNHIMHWPGIEPGPPAWQARILPLNHQCKRITLQIFLIFQCSKQCATLSICGQERRRGDETLRRKLIDRNLSTV